MAEYQTGSFCWIDLATTDAAAAKKFYGTLFGWEMKDSPLPQGGVYTMCLLGGKEVGALYDMDPGQREAKAPPHWMNYVSVPSADTAAARAKSLGASVTLEPFDVMDVGRMAVIADPTGAHLALWEAKKHKGGHRFQGEPGSYCWNELTTTDLEKAEKFYSHLFEWKLKPSANSSMRYVEIYGQDQRPMGGMMARTPDMGNVPPHWMVYFAVSDCDQSANQAKSLGAKLYVPPTDIPRVGRFSVLSDPQGATFAIIQLQH